VLTCRRKVFQVSAISNLTRIVSGDGSKIDLAELSRLPAFISNTFLSIGQASSASGDTGTKLSLIVLGLRIWGKARLAPTENLADLFLVSLRTHDSIRLIMRSCIIVNTLVLIRGSPFSSSPVIVSVSVFASDAAMPGTRASISTLGKSSHRLVGLY